MAAEAEHKKILNSAVNAVAAERDNAFKEEKKQIAKTLLSAGLDILEIMRATKLSRAEVELA